MDEAEIEMNRLLRQRHRLAEGMENDFTVRNLAALAAVASGAAEVMSLMLGAIASVSLLVGGIGIMNIMLVSVTERTREIGIRMAIGPIATAILTQFLLEALVICLFWWSYRHCARYWRSLGGEPSGGYGGCHYLRYGSVGVRVCFSSVGIFLDFTLQKKQRH